MSIPTSLEGSVLVLASSNLGDAKVGEFFPSANLIPISPTNNNDVIRFEWKGTPYTMTLPSATYDVATLNTAFRLFMKSKRMYLVHASTAEELYYMSFVAIDQGITFQIAAIPYDAQYPPGFSPPPLPMGIAVDNIWPYASTSPPPMVRTYPAVPSLRTPTTYFTKLVQNYMGNLNADVDEEQKSNTVTQFFETAGPPPTEMTVTVNTKFLDLNVRSNDVHVYLNKYILDCVWRDSEDPKGNLTANSGTSISRRVKVFLYAGNPSGEGGVRLMTVPMYRDLDAEGGGTDPDFYIHRNQAYIYEKAFNPYHTNLTLSSDSYFENQYTQQTQSYDEPGLYLGKMQHQAILALQRTRQITIRWETDRAPEFPSPFWDQKFLRGASVWNPDTNAFEIQDPGSTYNSYFLKLQQISLANTATATGNVAMTGGPYFPLTLYSLSHPHGASAANFINYTTIRDVHDPKDGEMCAYNKENVTLRVGQVAVRNTTDLSTVSTLNWSALAPSDLDNYSVSAYDTATGTTVPLKVYDRLSTTPVPPRYQVPDVGNAGTASIHFPNGEWRGQALASANTAVTDWKSPFPWEQSLTEHQLGVLNETVSYNEAVGNTQIVDVRKYLFMDPGTSWNEHGGNATIGERSLQFDFGGTSQFINKFQLIFPRSQEDHQPYRVEASMQKVYKGSADVVVDDAEETFWFGGVQFAQMSGSRTSPNKYRYLNTHTQTTPRLGGAYTQLWDVNSRQVGSEFISPSSTSASTANTVVYTTERGRANVVSVDHVPKWYTETPNSVNPALDFQRQEFGPFARGCTMAELKNTDLCKAWSTTSVADMSPIRTVNGIVTTSGTKFFFDMMDYMSSAAGSEELGYCVYVRKAGEQSDSASINSDWRAVTSSITGERFAAVEQANVHTYFQGTWTKRDAFTASPSTLSYSSISSSGSGNSIIACVDGGSVRISTDAGLTATVLPATTPAGVSVGPQAWKDVVLAADGLTGLAVANSGNVYKYSAGGGTLTVQPNQLLDNVWVDIAASETGTTIAAITETQVYISTNSGATWTIRTPPVGTSEVTSDGGNPWVSVAVSADGSRVAAAPEVGRIIQTTNGGDDWDRLFGMPPNFGSSTSRKTWQNIIFSGGYNITGTIAASQVLTYNGSTTLWTAQTKPFPELFYDEMAMDASADGLKRIMGVYGGDLWLSFGGDIGQNTSWIKQTSTILPADGDLWKAVAMSANGAYAAAVVEDGYIYVYNFNNSTWTRADSAGFRTWKAVSISETGQYMYAAVEDGYVYGSSNSGQDWTRDVSPGTYQTWTGIVIRENGKGIAIATDYTGTVEDVARTYNVSINAASTAPTFVSKTSTALPWKAVDSSNDGEIAVAVVQNGNVHTSSDSGETWTIRPNAGTRPWVGVVVSADGRRRVALGENGNLAISFSNTEFAYGGLGTWTPSIVPPAADHVWTSLDCSDDLSILLATQRHPTSNTGRVYASSWNATTNSLNPWTLEARISKAARWNSVALSRDGNRAVLGATDETLYLLDTGTLWYRMTTSADNWTEIKALAAQVGPKVRTLNATNIPPPILLNTQFETEFNNATSLFANVTFQETVYDYVFGLSQDNPKYLYLVDCERTPSKETEDVLVQYKDGQIQFVNDAVAANVSGNVVETYRVTGTLGPQKDFIVKESYYFAPQYNQYDTKRAEIIDGVTTFQPAITGPQKMVNPSLATGQHFGVAFGSFLNDQSNQKNNQVYTRGQGNAMKVFSFRPLTQLFSYKTTSGVIKDTTGTATTPATFENTIVKGIVANVQVAEAGTNYVEEKSTRAYVHPTLDDAEKGMYYDPTTGTFADTTIYLWENAPPSVLATANATFTVPRHAEFQYKMATDNTSIRETFTASAKTASLRRSAEIHLRMLPSPKPN